MEKDNNTPFDSIPEVPQAPEPNGQNPQPQGSESPAPPPMPGGIAPSDAPAEYQASFSIGADEVEGIKPGIYDAKLIKVEPSVSKTSGNQMYVWTYVIISGQHAGEELINYTALTPAAMFKLRETLHALNIQPVNGVYNFQPVDHSMDTNGVLNKVVRLDVVLQEYEGSESPSIKKVLAPATPGL